MNLYGDCKFAAEINADRKFAAEKKADRKFAAEKKALIADMKYRVKREKPSVCCGLNIKVDLNSEVVFK